MRDEDESKERAEVGQDIDSVLRGWTEVGRRRRRVAYGDASRFASDVMDEVRQKWPTWRAHQAAIVAAVEGARTDNQAALRELVRRTCRELMGEELSR